MALRPPATASVLAVLFATLPSLGCDEPETLRSLDLAELPERFACDDVTVVAASLDGHEALLIGIEDGLAAEALDSGAPVEAVYELPDPRLIVRWVAGSDVSEGQCGRDGDDAWQLDARRDAIAGTLSVRLSPTPDGALLLHAQLDALVLAGEHERGVYELTTTELTEVPVED